MSLTIEELLLEMNEKLDVILDNTSKAKLTTKRRRLVRVELETNPDYTAVINRGGRGAYSEIATMLTNKLGFVVDYQNVYYAMNANRNK